MPWYIPSEQYDDLDLDLVITSAWHEPRVQVVVPADAAASLESGSWRTVAARRRSTSRETTATCDM